MEGLGEWLMEWREQLRDQLGQSSREEGSWEDKSDEDSGEMSEKLGWQIGFGVTMAVVALLLVMLIILVRKKIHNFRSGPSYRVHLFVGYQEKGQAKQLLPSRTDGDFPIKSCQPDLNIVYVHKQMYLQPDNSAKAQEVWGTPVTVNFSTAPPEYTSTVDLREATQSPPPQYGRISIA